MESLKKLAKLYQSFLDIGAERSNYIELKTKQYLGAKGSMTDSLIFDEDCYRVLFSSEYFSTIVDSYSHVRASLQQKSFAESQDEINSLAFLQDFFFLQRVTGNITMICLTKY